MGFVGCTPQILLRCGERAMRSDLREWLFHHVVTAVKEYDSSASSPSESFSDLYENRQSRALAQYFSRLPDVEATSQYPYRTRGRESADLFIERNQTRIVCEYKAMYKTWYLENGRPYPA